MVTPTRTQDKRTIDDVTPYGDNKQDDPNDIFWQWNVPPYTVLPEKPNSEGGNGWDRIAREITIEAIAGTKVPLFYGQCEVPGKIIYETVKNGSLWVVYALGWGPIQAIDEIRFENKVSTDFRIGYVAKYTGTASQALDSTLATVEPNWVSALPGIAYVVIEFLRPSDDPLDKPTPDYRNAKFRCRGRLLLDPRLDPTLVTRYYTDNAALVAFDVQTFTYAGEEDPANFHITSVSDTANICDNDLGGGKKRFRNCIYISEKRPYSQWLEILRLHCQLNINYNSGKWYYWIDEARATSDIVLTDVGPSANIVSATVRQKGVAECPNQVKFTFTNIAAEYKADEALTEDPGIAAGTVREVFPAVFDTQGVPVDYQAKNLSIWRYNKARLDTEYRFVVSYEGIEILPGLVLTVTSEDVKVSSELMTVTEVQQNGIEWNLICELYDSTVYSNVILATTLIMPPVGQSPYDTVLPLTSITITEISFFTQEGIQRKGLQIDWARPDDYFYDRVSFDLNFEDYYNPGVVTTTHIGSFKRGPVQIPVERFGTYEVAGSVINTVGKYSDLLYSNSVLYEGRLFDTPLDLKSIYARVVQDQIEILLQKDADIIDPNFKHEVRWLFVTEDTGTPNENWLKARFIAQTDSSSITTQLAFGLIRLYAKALDSSGQYSGNPVTVDIAVDPQEMLGTSVREVVDDIIGDTVSPLDKTYFYQDTNALIEHTGSYQRVYLSRKFSPAEANAEIAAGNYDSILAWMEWVESPRTKRVGHWAPLPAPLTVEMPPVYSMSGPGMRNLRYNFYVDKVQNIGLDTPNAIAYAKVFMGSVDKIESSATTGVDGTNIYFGLVLSTNSPFFQAGFIGSTSGADPIRVHYKSKREPALIYPYTTTVTTDSTGDYIYNLLNPLPASCLIRPQLICLDPNVVAYVTARSNTSFTIKTLVRSTGANAPNVSVNIFLEDWGEGGNVTYVGF